MFAPAKINLCLHVGAKRPDGFHELESLVVFARAGDELSFAASDALSLTVDGPFADALAGEADNLVLRAARALQAAGGCACGARIALTKNLPVASGIGGGSTDAAAALRGLDALWGLKMAPDALRRIGEGLGSDVPVCVEPAASWMAGRGESVTALAGIPRAPMVLVNPNVPVPTGQVFRALSERRGVGLPMPPPMDGLDALIAWLRRTGNDLEAPARIIAPAVAETLDALQALPGALMARMSGSGATCFALFDSDETARDASLALRTDHPDWWCAAG